MRYDEYCSIYTGFSKNQKFLFSYFIQTDLSLDSISEITMLPITTVRSALQCVTKKLGFLTRMRMKAVLSNFDYPIEVDPRAFIKVVKPFQEIDLSPEVEVYPATEENHVEKFFLDSFDNLDTDLLPIGAMNVQLGTRNC